MRHFLCKSARQRQTVRLAMESLATGAMATEAAKYDLTAAAATALEKERTDYETLVTAPAQGISGRKALTGQLRTVGIIDAGLSAPRLVTAYPGGQYDAL